jgi:hypothetical protein
MCFSFHRSRSVYRILCCYFCTGAFTDFPHLPFQTSPACPCTSLGDMLASSGLGCGSNMCFSYYQSQLGYVHPCIRILTDLYSLHLHVFGGMFSSAFSTTLSSDSSLDVCSSIEIIIISLWIGRVVAQNLSSPGSLNSMSAG